MQNHNTEQTSTETTRAQKLVLPQVRYHPSIQTPVGSPGPKTTKKNRAGGANIPHPGTDSQAENNQSAAAVKAPPGGGHKQGRKPVKETAATDAGPAPKPPTLEQVPLDVGVCLDRCVVEEVEVLTRGQRNNPDWFAWRKNRITASVAHSIAHSRFVNGKSKTPPSSYLAAVTGEGPRVQTRAMSWGVHKEAEVVRRYQKLKTLALGRQVSVQDCGLFIDPQRPWLAASPDGIVTDRRTGRWLLCLEVKCPYKHRHRLVEDACREDPAFCLQIHEEDGQEPGGAPVYRLKTSHSYYTQIQCQLAVTGLQQADLVVFTLKETAVVRVTFDPELWEQTVSKLEVFYRDAVLPHVRQKVQQHAAAAGTPEL
ncbi:uncharacterized protein LOC115790089 [Archocentrus centrarchus]|uniref:uncharacterized protein LOC115790089 n=1 Tax=Archocentrus centrarchus TaxID=63155 RepID=UPI0011E9EC1E|nr:uncharacterized protein LOC115790089 [Archocentrus centrarchus]XP_030599620.1 uncharacterized protein LOC115790089 [Archocentrus centrarchus]